MPSNPKELAQRIVGTLKHLGYKKWISDFDGTILKTHTVHGTAGNFTGDYPFTVYYEAGSTYSGYDTRDKEHPENWGRYDDNTELTSLSGFEFTQGAPVAPQHIADHDTVKSWFADRELFIEILRECERQGIEFIIDSKQNEYFIHETLVKAGIPLDLKIMETAEEETQDPRDPEKLVRAPQRIYGTTNGGGDKGAKVPQLAAGEKTLFTDDASKEFDSVKGADRRKNPHIITFGGGEHLPEYNNRNNQAQEKQELETTDHVNTVGFGLNSDRVEQGLGGFLMMQVKIEVMQKINSPSYNEKELVNYVARAIELNPQLTDDENFTFLFAGRGDDALYTRILERSGAIKPPSAQAARAAAVPPLGKGTKTQLLPPPPVPPPATGAAPAAKKASIGHPLGDRPTAIPVASQVPQMVQSATAALGDGGTEASFLNVSDYPVTSNPALSHAAGTAARTETGRGAASVLLPPPPPPPPLATSALPSYLSPLAHPPLNATALDHPTRSSVARTLDGAFAALQEPASAGAAQPLDSRVGHPTSGAWPPEHGETVELAGCWRSEWSTPPDAAEIGPGRGPRRRDRCSSGPPARPRKRRPDSASIEWLPSAWGHRRQARWARVESRPDEHGHTGFQPRWKRPRRRRNWLRRPGCPPESGAVVRHQRKA